MIDTNKSPLSFWETMGLLLPGIIALIIWEPIFEEKLSLFPIDNKLIEFTKLNNSILGGSLIIVIFLSFAFCLGAIISRISVFLLYNNNFFSFLLKRTIMFYKKEVFKEFMANDIISNSETAIKGKYLPSEKVVSLTNTPNSIEDWIKENPSAAEFIALNYPEPYSALRFASMARLYGSISIIFLFRGIFEIWYGLGFLIWIFVGLLSLLFAYQYSEQYQSYSLTVIQYLKIRRDKIFDFQAIDK